MIIARSRQHPWRSAESHPPRIGVSHSRPRPLELIDTTSDGGAANDTDNRSIAPGGVVSARCETAHVSVTTDQNEARQAALDWLASPAARKCAMSRLLSSGFNEAESLAPDVVADAYFSVIKRFNSAADFAPDNPEAYATSVVQNTVHKLSRGEKDGLDDVDPKWTAEDWVPPSDADDLCRRGAGPARTVAGRAVADLRRAGLSSASSAIPTRFRMTRRHPRPVRSPNRHVSGRRCGSPANGTSSRTAGTIPTSASGPAASRRCSTISRTHIARFIADRGRADG